MNAIEIRGLKKSFRGLYALDGLDITVPQGAIYGFIGGIASLSLAHSPLRRLLARTENTGVNLITG